MGQPISPAAQTGLRQISAGGEGGGGPVVDWLGDAWGWISDDFWPWWNSARLQVLLTVSTLATALGLAARPDLRRWRRRPKLSFELGDEEPFARITRSPQSKGVTGDQVRVRAGLRNLGKDPARRVVVKLSRWIERDDWEWVERDIDPMALHWAGLPDANEQGEPRPEVDIYPGEMAFINVLVRQWQAGTTRIQPHDRQPGDEHDRQAWHPYRHQMFELMAWSESATEPTVLRLEISFAQGDLKPRVRTIRSLPSGSRAGLLNKFSKAAGPLTDQDRRDLGLPSETTREPPAPEEHPGPDADG